MQINKGKAKTTLNQAVASQSSLLPHTQAIDEDKPAHSIGLAVLIGRNRLPYGVARTLINNVIATIDV